jgi:glycosyltransferase involved in cell wall biosynthesis
VWHEAAGATAVSGFVQELAEKAYRRPVRRIVNGIELADRPAEESLRVSGVPHLLFVGRFNPQKNAPLLIDALAPLAEMPWKLTMIGDGPDGTEVRRRIEAHRLGDRVTLAGWRNAAEVHETMAGADVLCMPSSSEGMPVAAIEALKYGLAIAASDIPGMRDVVRSGDNGLAASVGDPRAFGAIVRELISNPERLLAMKHASWRKAREFELGQVIAQYEEVLARAPKNS